MPADLPVTTLTEYQARDELPVAVAFPPLVVDSLAAHLSRLGLRQLHVAETEKYAHVTYFFNGGVEEPLPGEERMLVPSRREVADLRPGAGDERRPDHRRARGGHRRPASTTSSSPTTPTRTWSATPASGTRRSRRPEFIDGCLGRVARGGRSAPAARSSITADHGNIEEMRDADGEPQTKHTTAAGAVRARRPTRRRRRQLRDGILADVAPTLCAAAGHPDPAADDRAQPHRC